MAYGRRVARRRYVPRPRRYNRRYAPVRRRPFTVRRRTARR